MTILDDLTRALQNDERAIVELQAHGVAPETYAAFAYDDELRKSRRIGLVIGSVLAVGLFLAGFFASAESVSEPRSQWLFGLGGGVLGAVITWGTMRQMAGKRWKYVDEPEETASGFHLLGMLHRLDGQYLGKLDEHTWAKLKAYKPDLKAKRYERLPTGSKSEQEKAKLMHMTPGKERLVARLTCLQRWSVYAMLLVVLVPFMENLFFLLWLWFFAGLWLALESIAGIVKRHIGTSSETTAIDLYGWPARVYAWFMLVLSIVLFIIPGLLGMWKSLL